MENALITINKFECISGLKLNVKDKGNVVRQVGKQSFHAVTLNCTRDPVKILGIYFSYDEKQNNHFNFELKIQNLQTKFDIWKSRNLTLLGKALIIKSLELSQLVHSVSNINVPSACITATSKKLFSFLWNNKRDRIKRDCLYQDYKMGGICMPDVYLMTKGLCLAWLPRLLNTAKQK